ncbi:hypothetical protein GBA52_009938 [Prunus armeniaca]|nr:hypothetical protein GBA52_009938 [Prunus armeniaca]
MWPSLKLRLVTSKSCWRRTLSNGISSKKNIESPKNHLTTNLARMISRSNIHSKCRKVADPRDGSQHTSSKDKTAQSPEDPQSVHLIGPQNIKTAEKSLAVKEPAANCAPCVSSLKIAQVLDQTETIAELLNVC